MRDFQRMLHTNGGRLPHVSSRMGCGLPHGAMQCKMKRGGWDSTSTLSCHCTSPLLMIFLLSFPSSLFSPGLWPVLKLLVHQMPKMREGYISVLMDATATSNSRYPALQRAFTFTATISTSP